ncbi:uncharacterized protein LOC127850612 isoform X9 [Dreissena polymorpha]|uniref:uncharacterized protein LOC127850612 isoform X9 n=1 Tax=Dreissena polymorpha TaxID=45954 RepID=UPI002264B7F1|nr:uncharacterized protein LOC127850612 isoform X9 [Dreissena polymorpha]
MWNLSVDMEAAPKESRMQNKESDIGVRRASNKKRHQNFQSIMQIPEHFSELSIRMFDALDDSGAGKETVLERRRTYLQREHFEKIARQLLLECFHFGSQSEGTTTPGLQSDIDFLLSKHIVNIMTIWEDWRAGMINLLMLHDNTTPPQQYLLQVIQDYTPEPMTSLTDDSGHLQAAVRVLEDVERRYHSKVKAVCGCREYQRDGDLKVFADMLLGNTDNSELPLAFCVNFSRQESHCAPFILLFEMNRNITDEEVKQRAFTEKQWMDSAEVDARPFLYYLQYLTYGGLGARDKQLHAWRVLESYICDIRNKINLYHQETAVNLLGHCYEMEGEYEGALNYYEESLGIYDTNNAAYWHVRRVLRLLRD